MAEMTMTNGQHFAEIEAAVETSQVARVYHEIKWRIVYGRYKPGTHISETVLARVCRASRTPIREALARLVGDGYVVSMPGRGFAIAPLSVNLVRSTFQMRRILETAAAENAASVATSDEIQQMRRLADYSGTLGNGDPYRAALGGNVDFHIAVARATHNDLLVDNVYTCLMHMYRVLSLGGNFERFEEGTAEEHHELVDAIEQHNPMLARHAIERHVDHAANVIMGDVVEGRIKGLAV